ncbi:MAG: phosphoglycerate mutase family protein [Bacteroidota bacterium]
MKKISLLLLCLILGAGAYAQDQSMTTFILVRHAEKADDGTKDPSLTEKGLQRAQDLKYTLSDMDIDLIYSSDYKRTMLTAKPIADSRNLTISNYKPFQWAFIDELLEQQKGKTILISGHSNSTPHLVNYLIGKEAYSNLDYQEYNSLFIVSVIEKGNASVSKLKFGATNLE